MTIEHSTTYVCDLCGAEVPLLGRQDKNDPNRPVGWSKFYFNYEEGCRKVGPYDFCQKCTDWLDYLMEADGNLLTDAMNASSGEWAVVPKDDPMVAHHE